MSKAKKNAVAKKAATKIPKYVRRSIREDAIIYIPGEGIPEKLQDLIDDKVQDAVDECTYRMMNRRPNPPSNPEEAVSGIYFQLSGLSSKDNLTAIAMFLQQWKDNAESRLQMADHARKNGETHYDRAYNDLQTVQNILRGDFAVISQPKTVQLNGDSSASINSTRSKDSERTKN